MISFVPSTILLFKLSSTLTNKPLSKLSSFSSMIILSRLSSLPLSSLSNFPLTKPSSSPSMIPSSRQSSFPLSRPSNFPSTEHSSSPSPSLKPSLQLSPYS